MSEDATLVHLDPPRSLIGRQCRPRRKLLSVFVCLCTSGAMLLFGYHALFPYQDFPQTQGRKFFLNEIIAISPPPIRFVECLLMTGLLAFFLIYLIRKALIGEIQILQDNRVCGIDWRASRLCLNYGEIVSVDRSDRYITVRGSGRTCRILCWEWGVSKEDRVLLYEHLRAVALRNRAGAIRH